MHIDEPVHVAEHDPAWVDWFQDERQRLLSALSDDVRVEHIGSTAVPDLVAKPIVDILIGVAPGTDLQAVADQLEELGYEPLGEAGVPGRLHLRRRGARSFNVSVVHVGSELWRDNLALREHLRHHPSARHLYAEAKLAAVESGATMLLAYSDAKAPTVAELVAEAVEWRHPDVLDAVRSWAQDERGVVAVALVGSYARGDPGPASDVDLVVVVDDVDRWVNAPEWVSAFGVVEQIQREDWGMVQSLRVHYQDGPQIEFGLTTPDWTMPPIDPGTASVIDSGFVILFDPAGLLADAAR